MAPQAGKSPYDVRSLKLAKPGQLPQTIEELPLPFGDLGGVLLH